MVSVINSTATDAHASSAFDRSIGGAPMVIVIVVASALNNGTACPRAGDGAAAATAFSCLKRARASVCGARKLDMLTLTWSAVNQSSRSRGGQCG